MARPATVIHGNKLSGVRRGMTAVTLHSKVTDGPASQIGRQMTLFLDETDIALLLTTLAQTPAYRDVFRAVADELDTREAKAEHAAPVDAVAYDLGSQDTARRLRELVVDTLSL